MSACAPSTGNPGWLVNGLSLSQVDASISKRNLTLLVRLFAGAFTNQSVPCAGSMLIPFTNGTCTPVLAFTKTSGG